MNTFSAPRALLFALITWILAVPIDARAECVTSGKLAQICGLQSPEDMEVLPGGREILISEMAGEHDEPGKFALLDVSAMRAVELAIEKAPHTDWGDPHCAQRPAAQLSPHGIHLSRLNDGRLLLLAINHGNQESVHAYEVLGEGARRRLAWRGCVDTDYNFNDLAATPDGFIGSHQFDKPMGEGPNANKRLFGGANTGFAVRWSVSGGFEKISGSEAAFPNGITVSADGKTAWMAATAGREIRKFDLTRNMQTASAALPLAPDNLSWTADGHMLVTGSDDIQRLIECAAVHTPCKVPFAVASIDPATLESRVIYRNDGTYLMGASVAIITRGTLYLGSFAGDHILRAPAPSL